MYVCRYIIWILELTLVVASYLAHACFILADDGILDNPEWIATSTMKWSAIVDKIINLANLEAEHCKSVRDKLAEMSECGMITILSFHLYIRIYIYILIL